MMTSAASWTSAPALASAAPTSAPKPLAWRAMGATPAPQNHAGLAGACANSKTVHSDSQARTAYYALAPEFLAPPTPAAAASWDFPHSTAKPIGSRLGSAADALLALGPVVLAAPDE